MSSEVAKPQRVQLRRTKGWRLPPNTVVVSRPSRWGNPFRVGESINGYSLTVVKDAAHAVRLYRRWLFHQQRSENLIPELRGHNLACWCPPDQPCHADVLLEMANG